MTAASNTFRPAVLLLAHGTPGSPDDVPAYMRNITGGRPIPDAVMQEVQHRYALIGQSPHAGWFAYVPYTLKQYSPGYNMDFYALALLFLTISTTAGAINFITTIFRFRAPGMAVSRMP